jgi:hypothetical protein
MLLVNNIPDLQAAINIAKTGDVITLANNTYVTDATITIPCNGVIIVAQSLGKVIFQGGSISFVITGSNNTLSGFQFNYGTTITTRPIDLIQIRGSNNIIDNMNFNGFFVQHYINIYNPSQHNCIQYCNFQGKPTDQVINGSQIEVQGDATVVGYHKISHCSFQKMIGNGGDFGCEPIRLGEGSMSTYDLATTVEYCIFDNTQLADSEVISVKSRKNVIRYNTFRNNPNAMVSFRNGDYNVAYGNFFLGSGGIKIKQASNIYLYNNYFESSSTPVSFIDVSMYPNPSTYENNIVFQNNTFNHCGNICLGTSQTQRGNSFYNNILYNTSVTAPNTLVAFEGNIYFNSKGVVYDPTNKNADPLFVTNAAGYSSIGAGSPAIGYSGSSNINMTILNVDIDSKLLLDITGSARPISKTCGCSEVYGGAINVPLSVSNTGPSYLLNNP